MAVPTAKSHVVYILFYSWNKYISPASHNIHKYGKGQNNGKDKEIQMN